MYGKKRIVIQKNNQIVLAGGRSWIPVGLIIKYPDFWEQDWEGIRAKVVKKRYIYSCPRDENNFDEVYVPNKKALKELVNNRFNFIKEEEEHGKGNQKQRHSSASCKTW